MDTATFSKTSVTIKIDLYEPPLYHHEVVDVILRTLPKADDIAHRMILLYQVIEYLFEITASSEINTKINRLTSKTLCLTEYH